MCTHVVLLAPLAADSGAVIALANAHGFRASTDLWPGESTRQGRFKLFDPEGSTCDCGTPIGSSRRKPPDLRRLERESRKGKRRKWSAERRRKWVEQCLRASERSAGPASADVASSLRRWCELAQAAAADPRIERIGVLVREAGTRCDEWRPTETTTATIAEMLHVAKYTPTWLLPA